MRNVAEATGGQPASVDNRTLEQFTQLPNKMAELTKNTDTNGETRELNQDIFSRFDELWRMRKSSAITLTGLE